MQSEDSTFGSAVRFFKRNRGKFILGSVAAGGFLLLKKYLGDVERNWDESSLKDFVSEVKKKETHFEKTKNTCNEAVINLSPGLMSVLEKQFNVDTILQKLQHDRTNKELWSELKVRLFSQIVGEIYSLSLFVCFSKLQLSVVAGYQYLDSCNRSSPSNVVMKNEIQIFYLSFLERFFNKGVHGLLETIESVVSDAIQDIPLDKMMNFQNLKLILDKVSSKYSDNFVRLNPTPIFILLDTKWDELPSQDF